MKKIETGNTFESWFVENRNNLKEDYDQHIFAMGYEGREVKSLREFALSKYEQMFPDLMNPLSEINQVLKKYELEVKAKQEVVNSILENDNGN